MIGSLKKLASLGIILTSLVGLGCQSNRGLIDQENQSLGITTMRITSPAFNPGELIPQKYTCDGDDVNPELVFSSVPQDAASLALIVDDPDAVSGLFSHWLVWNIRPDVGGIAENTRPSGAVEGTTGFGRQEWGGPCPPSGSHRYRFKLYALDTMLELAPATDQQKLEQSMTGHIIQQAELLGLYARSR